MKTFLKPLSVVLLLVACCFKSHIEAQTTAPGPSVPDKMKAAAVLVLAGEGSGRLRSVGTGVVVSADGAILVPWHVVKDAAEVQVRLASGDVYDHVTLQGTDDRRDVAALKIAARGLTFLPTAGGNDVAVGDAVYALTNTNGPTFGTSTGTVSAVRPADEVKGAGAGYRLIEFSGAVGATLTSGILADSSGHLIGVVTRGQGNQTGFAVPAESVLGLMDGMQVMQMGAGGSLQLPKEAAGGPSSSGAVASKDPDALIRNAKTIYLQSKTEFLTIDTLQRALLANKRWKDLDLKIVQDPRLADLQVMVDRPLFTYVHTFVLTDKKTTIVLGTGKKTAFDGTIASDGLADQIVKTLADVRLPATPKK